MNHYIKHKIKDGRGSTMTTVILVMTILTVLSMGILSASLNNLKQTKSITSYEQCYYAAEAAVQNAVEIIKKEVSDYYMTLYASANYSAYVPKMPVFFQNIYSSAVAHMEEPDFKSDVFNGSTNTTLSITPDAVSADVAGKATITIESTANIANVQRTVVGTIEIDKTNIIFQETTVPMITDEMLLVGGDINIDNEGSKNVLTVVGTARIGGTVTDPLAFGATEGYTMNDPLVEKYLNWKLYYNQFDKSIPMPQTPPILADDGTIPTLVIDNGQFLGSTTNTTELNGLSIFSIGDIVIENHNIRNCNIFATGSITIRDTDTKGNNYVLENTNLYAYNGSIFVELDDIINHAGNPRAYKAAGDITFNIGYDKGSVGSTLGYAQITAGGNFFLDSLSSSEDDALIQSNIYAGGTLKLGTSLQGNTEIPNIDNVSSCFMHALGDITLFCANLEISDPSLSNKVHSHQDITVYNYETHYTYIYADDDITITSNDDDTTGASYPYSTNNVLAAGDDMFIYDAYLKDSYIYCGDDLTIELLKKSLMVNCIIYAEDSIAYSHPGSLYDNVLSTLFYTNGDFYFSQKGTGSINTGDGTGLQALGVQIMAKGNIYSLESDDIDNSETDYLRLGEGDFMDFSIIEDNIGGSDATNNIMAVELFNHGFEHELPEEEIVKILPNYGEVFISQSIYEKD